MSILKIMIMTLFACVLLGCQPDSSSYTYLMQHPEALQKKLSDCQQTSTENCTVIKQAAQDFFALSKEFEENPELFGQKILQAQQVLVEKQQAFENAKRNRLTTESTLKAEYQVQLDKVNALLAVASLSAPE